MVRKKTTLENTNIPEIKRLERRMAKSSVAWVSSVQYITILDEILDSTGFSKYIMTSRKYSSCFLGRNSQMQAAKVQAIIYENGMRIIDLDVIL